MQQKPAESQFKLSKSSESVMQPASTHCAQLPRAINNPRFALTPETMGMNIRSDSPKRIPQPQQQHTTPVVVDVKSYYERHSSNYPVETFTDCRQDSSTLFQSSYPCSTTHSLRGAGTCLALDPNNRNDLMAQSPSPTGCSPQTPQQQWNFEHTTTQKKSLQLPHAKTPTDHHHNMLLKCAEETKGKPSGQQQLQSRTSAAPSSPNVTFATDMASQGQNYCLNDSAKLNFQTLNNIYARRIEDIDANAWDDKDLKIFTYQEWVELLVKINESFLNTIEELEREVAGRLDLLQRRANTSCRHSQGDDVMKCRKDIGTLLKYIKNSNSNNKHCDISDVLTLETLTPDQVQRLLDNSSIGDNNGEEIKHYTDPDMVQRNKLYANMKALAQEVAEKHDEVRELKRQVVCLENEIQNAQKKIQLKEDVIKELRNDLKCANNNNNNNNKSPSNPCLETSLAMSSIHFDDQIPCSANTLSTDNTSTFQGGDNGSQFECLSHSEQEEQEKIRILQDEINDLLEISNLNKQQIEQHLKKVKEVVKKLVEEKLDACRKLDFISQQLIDLESESSEGKSDCDSGFRSNSENDQNVKLLDAIRQRLRRRNDIICELKKKNQTLEVDNNELSARLKAEASFHVRSSDILKTIADLLCELRGKQFSYTKMYKTDTSQMNPFCEAIVEMQKDFKEKETQLIEALKTKDKEIEDLTDLLFKCGKDCNPERTLRANRNDFEEIEREPVTQFSSTPTPPTPPSLQLSSTLHFVGTKRPLTSSTELLKSDSIPVTTFSQPPEESD